MTIRRIGLFAGMALMTGCAQPRPLPAADFAALEAGTPGRCVPARREDFEGAGEAALQGYVARLARQEGSVPPEELSLVVARGEPKASLAGVTAGEVACALGYGPPYRITLYREALVGRPRAVAYQVAAHEYQHAAQIRRDRLPCGADPAARERYEQEAAAFAEQQVPSCP